VQSRGNKRAILSAMKSIQDQMVGKGIVSETDTPEAKREAERAARPPEVEKRLPPPFEAPARGVIVASKPRPAIAKRECESCGAALPASHNGDGRCAECVADR
jgi:hypothetical protein